ncbi:glycosyltransferase family 2 protein [Natronomonas salina]|uniref:glycosyltransferase family 2 protein n=1 Tax=Natronomonas salina TaxID=1710540 RepID=UPI0015B7467A|nr:glycosyltransferase family 2 protein [Natronomonas salina]QLD88770.1 glycosyltransferase family 2 protein [Natronomonas salina]
MPKVSVVIPTYNNEDTIVRAIQSVLTQSYTNLEIIVVNDCSTDDTYKKVNSIDDTRVNYFEHNKNRGGSNARNTGISIASGDYISFLDADDRWHSEKLKKQIDYIEKAQYNAVYCDIDRIYERKYPRIRKIVESIFGKNSLSGKEGGVELLRDSLLMRNFSTGGCSTLLIKSALVNKLGGFDERFSRHQDWEFRNRILKEGSLGFVDEKLVTKYGSSEIQPEIVEESALLYLDKFSDDIDVIESDGFDVHGRHYLRVAIAYFRNSNYNKGYEYLRKSNIYSSFKIIELMWNIIIGLKRAIRDKLPRR